MSCFIITPLPLMVSVCRSALEEPEPASPSVPRLPLLSASSLLVLGMMDMTPSLSNDHSTRHPLPRPPLISVPLLTKVMTDVAPLLLSRSTFIFHEPQLR